MLKTLIQLFIKQNGRNPNAVELLKLKFTAANQSGKGKVFDLTGKQIDTSKPIIGGKNVAETEAQIKARMIKENRSNVQKSYLRQLDKKIMDEMDMTAKEMENMSSTALDDLRRNADPVGMKKQFDEITEGRGLGDFADDPDFFKDDYASGGLARVGMFGGGPAVAKKIWQEFIEKLFIKSSNDIRLGKGKWAGLSQDQWIKQHDDLTKMLKKWEMSGKKGLPEGAEQYLGMNNLQITKAIKDAEKQVLSKPTKTLEGIKKEGTIDISNPEVADEFSRFMKESDPEGFKNLEQQIQLDDFDVTGRKKNASGGIAGQLHLNEGGRVPMIFGGSAGLKAMIKNMIEGINKGRKNKIKTLFPRYSVEEKELLKLGEKYLPRDAATLSAREIEGKAEGIQVLIDRLKNDKKIIEQMAKNKAMNDPGLDFMMKHLEKMENMYPPNLKKYTDIDKDILQMETIKKNLIMKDRKLNAEGGIAGQLHLNRPGYANGELAGWELVNPDVKKPRKFTPEEIEQQRELIRDMLKKQKEFYEDQIKNKDSLAVSKKIPEEQPPFQGPPYETNNPNEAGKEIIRRIIGSGVTGAPIGGKFSLDVPYGEGEDFDFGIGYKTDPGYSGITGGYGINLDGDDTMGIGYQGDNFGGGVKKQEGGEPEFTFGFKKKLKKKKKPIFGKAKGGLAKILGV